MLPHFLCVILVYYSGEFETTPLSRNIIVQEYCIIFLIIANFMAIDYLPHLLMRVIFEISLASMTINHRN